MLSGVLVLLLCSRACPAAITSKPSSSPMVTNSVEEFEKCEVWCGVYEPSGSCTQGRCTCGKNPAKKEDEEMDQEEQGEARDDGDEDGPCMMETTPDSPCLADFECRKCRRCSSSRLSEDMDSDSSPDSPMSDPLEEDEYVDAMEVDEFEQDQEDEFDWHEGFEMDDYLPEEDNPCTRNPCYNNGTCVLNKNRKNGFFCVCATGFSSAERCMPCSRGLYGDDCKKNCRNCDPLPNCHHVTGHCARCPDGFSGDECLKADCSSAIDPCLPGQCLNSKCVCPPHHDVYNCKLHTNHIGSRWRECPPTRTCSGGGTCYRDAKGQETCHCPPRRFPVGLSCVEGCAEGTVTCVNGRCRGDECLCDKGYKGEACEDSCGGFRYGSGCTEVCGECASLPCLETDGSCGAAGCLPGFNGPRCDELDLVKGLTDDDFTYIFRVWVKLEGRLTPAFVLRNSPEWKIWSNYVEEVSRLCCTSINGTKCLAWLDRTMPGSVQLSFTVSMETTPEDAGSKNLKNEFTKSLRKNGKQVQPPKGFKLLVSSIRVQEVARPDVAATTRKNKSRSILVPVALGTGAVLLILTSCLIMQCKSRNSAQRRRRSATRRVRTMPSNPLHNQYSKNMYPTRSRETPKY